MGEKGIGDVYTSKLTLSDTNPRRFETRSYTLRQLTLFADGKNVSMGRKGNVIFPLTRAGVTTLFNVDIADLWFSVTEATGTVYAIGTTKDE